MDNNTPNITTILGNTPVGKELIKTALEGSTPLLKFEISLSGSGEFILTGGPTAGFDNVITELCGRDYNNEWTARLNSALNNCGPELTGLVRETVNNSIRGIHRRIFGGGADE